MKTKNPIKSDTMKMKNYCITRLGQKS